MRIVLSKQLRDAGLEARELVPDNVPDDLVVDRVVAVDHTISQAHDLPQLGDLIDQCRLQHRRPAECLADDPQASLDRVPNNPSRS